MRLWLRLLTIILANILSNIRIIVIITATPTTSP